MTSLRAALLATIVVSGCANDHAPSEYVDAGVSVTNVASAPPAEEIAKVDEPARALVRSLRETFVAKRAEVTSALIVEGQATDLALTPDGYRPKFEAEDTKDSKTTVLLPRHADSPFVVSNADMKMRVRLVSAAHVEARPAGDAIVWDAPLPSSTLVHVPLSNGTEEYLVLSKRPTERSLSWDVELEGVAGVRVVDGTVELLDATGDPRLRTSAPWIVDSKGVVRRGSIAVHGCAYDTDDRAPWGRPVVAPESSHCVVEARWEDDGLAYPILIDPGWTDTNSMTQKRVWHRPTFFTATSGGCAGTGCVLATGGNYLETILSSAEVYNVAAGTWASASTIPGGVRWLHGSEPTGDGRVIVMGGCTTPSDWIAPGTPTTAIYDPTASPTWKAVANMTVPRGTLASTSVGKRIFVSGGGHMTTSFTVYNSTEEYDIATNTWTARGTMLDTRRLHTMTGWVVTGTCTPSPCVNVMVAGGVNGGGTLDTVEYSNGVGGWVKSSGALFSKRYGIAAVDIGPMVLLAGGLPTTGTPTDAIDAFTKSTLTTSKVGTLSVARGFAAGAIFTVGGATRALFAGGTTAVGSADQGMTVADTFVSGAPTGTTYPNAMKYRRMAAGATALGGGRVLVSGGRYGIAPGFLYPAKDEIFAPAANGTACTSATVGGCSSLACVDGYCCDKACTGQCEACNVATHVGTCWAVTGQAVAPRTACPGYGTTCGYKCDGSDHTKCNAPTTSTVCVAGSCAYNTTVKQYVETKIAYCTGSGACSVGAPVTASCGAYTCNGTKCRTICSTTTSTTDCAAGYTCKAGVCVTTGGLGTVCTRPDECASGFCVNNACCSTGTCPTGLTCNANGKGTCSKPNGAKCAAATECGSGFCVDGYCCNAKCTEQCAACNLGGLEGTCAAAAGKPVGTRLPCLGTGACQSRCDGATITSCKLWPGPETSCSAASCTTGIALTEAVCNGAGGCSTPKSTKCEPFACGAAACKETCATNLDCATGYVCKEGGNCATSGALGTICSADSECTSKHCVDGEFAGTKVCCSVASCGAGTYCAGTATGSAAGTCLKTEGTTCANGKECGSGFCVDGYCCDSACAGQCEACDAKLNEGKCSPILGDAHGTRPKCGDGAGNACRILECDGINRSSCLKFKNGPGTKCSDATCVDSVETEAGFCTGDGACLVPEPATCGLYVCGGTTCKKTCASNADCIDGYFCKGTKCEQLIANCSPDRLTSSRNDGSEATECKPYRCDTVKGTCLKDCATADDCAPGFACSEAKTCLPPDAAAGDAGGCGCSTPGHAGGTPLALGLLMGLFALRRRSSKSA